MRELAKVRLNFAREPAPPKMQRSSWNLTMIRVSHRRSGASMLQCRDIRSTATLLAFGQIIHASCVEIVLTDLGYSKGAKVVNDVDVGWTVSQGLAKSSSNSAGEVAIKALVAILILTTQFDLLFDLHIDGIGSS